MRYFLDEVEANYKIFLAKWPKDRDTAHGILLTKKEFFLNYQRIVSLQSWRACFLQDNISSEVLLFFIEAQNDALVSHILAMHGVWRSALKSLRSLIENVIFCVYYMDHPVEYRQWKKGQYNPTFSHLFDYLKRHPDLSGLKQNLDGVTILKNEWETLSKAVHGSAEIFRMTAKGTFPVLFSSDIASLGAWHTRESKCIYGINLLLVALFKKHLQGASLRDLRKAISIVIAKPTVQQATKKTLGVTLYV